MKATLLAVNVTSEARTFGISGRVAVSTGILALTDHPDEARRLALLRSLVGRVLLAPAERRHRVTAHAEVITVGRSAGADHRVALVAMASDGEPALAIVTFWEAALTGSDLVIDVREPAARWIQ